MAAGRRLLKQFAEGAVTTLFDKEFHTSMTRYQKHLQL